MPRKSAGPASERPQKQLQSLQTKAWANACLRSLRILSPGRQVTHYTLAAAAVEGREGTQPQITRCKQWLAGAPATLTSVHAFEASPKLQGALKVYEIGPWVDIGDGLSGAHVPLWEVIRGTRQSIHRAWRAVPAFVWKHWLPWEGEEFEPGQLPFALTHPRTFAREDLLQGEFAWQKDKLVAFYQGRDALVDLIRRGCERFLHGMDLLEQDAIGSLLTTELLAEENALKALMGQLGIAGERFCYSQERILLFEAENFLQRKRHRLKGRAPADSIVCDLDEEEAQLRSKVEACLYSHQEPREKDFLYHSQWEPPLKSKADLFRILRQCVEYWQQAPPLVVLAAAISVAKLLGEDPPAPEDLESVPYRIDYVECPSGYQIDEEAWDPLVQALGRNGLSVEEFNAAAAGYGVQIFLSGKAQRLAEEAEDEALFALNFNRRRKGT